MLGVKKSVFLSPSAPSSCNFSSPEIVPNQSLVNTNPFLDDYELGNLISCERMSKKGRAPPPPKKKSEELGSSCLFGTKEAKQSKRPAPQPPEGPKRSLKGTINKGKTDANPGTPAAQTKKESEDGSSRSFDHEKEEEESIEVLNFFQIAEDMKTSSDQTLPQQCDPTGLLRKEEPPEKVVPHDLSRSQKKFRAPLPPSNQTSKRLHQTDPTLPNHPSAKLRQTPVFQSKLKKDQDDGEEPQMKKLEAPVTVGGRSGSGSRTLWFNAVPGDGGDVRAQIAPASVIRQRAVKPLNPGEAEQSKSGELKAKKAVMYSPYSELSEVELMSMALQQQQLISLRDARIEELERYIDNLVLKVMEEKPSILMNLATKST